MSTQFCLRGISNKSLKRNVYNLSVVYDTIDKSDIMNIHKYLTVKNNVKQCSD